MCTDKIYTVDKRMMDLFLRHGVYKNTHYHIKETYKLKEYFDNLLRYNLYDLFLANFQVRKLISNGALTIHVYEIKTIRFD